MNDERCNDEVKTIAFIAVSNGTWPASQERTHPVRAKIASRQANRIRSLALYRRQAMPALPDACAPGFTLSLIAIVHRFAFIVHRFKLLIVRSRNIRQRGSAHRAARAGGTERDRDESG
jgi:hypothetical protein